MNFDHAQTLQFVEDKNDFICLPNNEENLFRSIEFDPMILRLHGRTAIVLKTTADKGKKLNFLSREELKCCIEKTIKRVFGFNPNIENFSQPTWAAEGLFCDFRPSEFTLKCSENFQGCYTNMALCPGKTFEQFYSSLNAPLGNFSGNYLTVTYFS